MTLDISNLFSPNNGQNHFTITDDSIAQLKPPELTGAQKKGPKLEDFSEGMGFDFTALESIIRSIANIIRLRGSASSSDLDSATGKTKASESANHRLRSYFSDLDRRKEVAAGNARALRKNRIMDQNNNPWTMYSHSSIGSTNTTTTPKTILVSKPGPAITILQAVSETNESTETFDKALAELLNDSFLAFNKAITIPFDRKIFENLDDNERVDLVNLRTIHFLSKFIDKSRANGKEITSILRKHSTSERCTGSLLDAYLRLFGIEVSLRPGKGKGVKEVARLISNEDIGLEGSALGDFFNPDGTFKDGAKEKLSLQAFDYVTNLIEGGEAQSILELIFLSGYENKIKYELLKGGMENEIQDLALKHPSAFNKPRAYALATVQDRGDMLTTYSCGNSFILPISNVKDFNDQCLSLLKGQIAKSSKYSPNPHLKISPEKQSDGTVYYKVELPTDYFINRFGKDGLESIAIGSGSIVDGKDDVETRADEYLTNVVKPTISEKNQSSRTNQLISKTLEFAGLENDLSIAVLNRKSSKDSTRQFTIDLDHTPSPFDNNPNDNVPDRSPVPGGFVLSS